MAMGNESAGDLKSLVKQGRAKDSRRLFRCENGITQAYGDYVERGQRGILGPRTDWDRTTITSDWIANQDVPANLDRLEVPTLAHEVGQWAMYPNLDEVKKYTGTLRQFNYDRYRQSLEEHHMLDQAKDFAQASGKFSVQLYKDEIEASLRTWPYGGFQLLEARDYPGQGTALVGWLDAFWDSKGLITPEEFRRFCGPTVCLLPMPARVFTMADIFTATAQVSHFGPKNLDAKPEWSITDERGQVIAKGQFPPLNFETGRLATAGEIKAPLDGVKAPARLVVTLNAAGTGNSWDMKMKWIYSAIAMAVIGANPAALAVDSQSLGTLIMAPYRVMIPQGLLKAIGNELQVEVTNLSANRIRDLDIRKVPWRIFKDINLNTAS